MPSTLMTAINIFMHLTKLLTSKTSHHDLPSLSNASPKDFSRVVFRKLHTIEINSYQVESCSETYLVSLRMFFNKVKITLSGSLFQHASILQGFIRPKGSNLCNNRAFCVSIYPIWDLNGVQSMHSRKTGNIFYHCKLHKK